MAQFGGGNGAFTPATNADNWVIEADTAGDVGKIKMISWGGRQTTAGAGNAYRTRWSRPSTNASGAFTSLVLQAGNPGASALCRIGTFATAATLATDPSNLYATDWSSFGGGGTIVLSLGGEWTVVNSATAGHQQVSCRNVAGVEASVTSYTVSWDE